MKLLIAILIVANVAGLGYNGWRFYDRALDSVNSQIYDRARGDSADLRSACLLFRANIQRITTAQLEDVENPSSYFQKQWQTAGIADTNSSGINIPLKSDESTGGRTWQEESWKVTFRDRDKLFTLRSLATYCQAVERNSPGFQIKALDVGKREGLWGKDEWKPTQIVIRRITPKAQN